MPSVYDQLIGQLHSEAHNHQEWPDGRPDEPAKPVEPTKPEDLPADATDEQRAEHAQQMENYELGMATYQEWLAEYDTAYPVYEAQLADYNGKIATAVAQSSERLNSVTSQMRLEDLLRGDNGLHDFSLNSAIGLIDRGLHQTEDRFVAGHLFYAAAWSLRAAGNL